MPRRASAIEREECVSAGRLKGNRSALPGRVGRRTQAQPPPGLRARRSLLPGRPPRPTDGRGRLRGPGRAIQGARAGSQREEAWAEPGTTRLRPDGGGGPSLDLSKYLLTTSEKGSINECIQNAQRTRVCPRISWDERRHGHMGLRRLGSHGGSRFLDRSSRPAERVLMNKCKIFINCISVYFYRLATI